MADESDVEAALVDILAAAIYPRGTDFPSSTGFPGTIAAGWPVSADLEADLAAGFVNVTVYPVQSSSGAVGQPFLTDQIVLVPAVHGLSATVTGSTIAFSGGPSPDEYATAVIAGIGYTYLTQAGDTVADVASGLASELSTAFPGTAASGASVQVATNQDVTLRIGSPAMMGERIHRQRQQFRIVVWAPTPEARTAVARVCDVALKRDIVIELADTTQALLNYVGTSPADTHELAGVYRRDLMLDVTYDTLDTYLSYEVTSVGIEIDPSPGAFARLPVISP